MGAAAIEVSPRRARWLRAIAYGLLAEVATIITIVVVVVVYKQVVAKGLSEAEYAAFGQSVGGMLGLVAGTIFTFLFARLLMPKLSRHFVAHGLVVAVTAIALSIGGSIAGHHGVPNAYLYASALKLAAGALAAFLYERASRENGRRFAAGE
ncbi:MAG TPA: hypothetical protein VM166_08325 [Gemmatimonadaceae bacterium]|nr:hypothetical protein [Gemmatimonadaceae bacterium]